MLNICDTGTFCVRCYQIWCSIFALNVIFPSVKRCDIGKSGSIFFRNLTSSVLNAPDFIFISSSIFIFLVSDNPHKVNQI